MARKPLDDVLRDIMSDWCHDDETRTYFEPPSDTDLNYPCVIYHQSADRDRFADNIIYKSEDRYDLIVVDEDPDSKLYKEFKKLLFCSLDRIYTSEGLKHWALTLHFKGTRIKEESDNEQDQVGPDRRKKVRNRH